MGDQAAVCPQCGSPGVAEARFCGVCGFEMNRSAMEHTASHPVIDIADNEAPFLVVIHGNNAGSRFFIDQSLTSIGRHPDSTVFLDDVTVSRRHAELTRTDTGFLLADVGSLNGTYVNGQRIESFELSEGDQIQVGKFRLVLAFGVADGRE